MIIRFKYVFLTIYIFSCLYPAPILGQPYIDNSKATITLPKNTSRKSIQNFVQQNRQTKLPSFEELVPASNYSYGYLQPVDLQGMKIAGLDLSSINVLSKSYFVVIKNSHFNLMSDIYENNRKLKRTSFVTLDYVWHCFVGLRNSISFSIIKNNLAYDLKDCLKAMLAACEEDYKICEDANIKADIKENSNLLKTALFILDPVAFKSFARSNDKNMDEINKIPLGFYNLDESVARTVKCLYYLSCLELPLIDESDETKINNFRRSVLLCRAIANSKLKTESGLNLWKKISLAQKFIFPALNNISQNKIYPYELSSKFFGQGINPDDFLRKLADPLFRTQLLLTIRHEKPTRLETSSFQSLNNTNSFSSLKVSFRLLPNLLDPSYIALTQVASEINQDNTARGSAPLTLMYLQSIKALTANDILRQLFPKLSPNIARWIYFMDCCQSGYILQSNTKSVYNIYIDWRFNTLNNYFALTKSRSQIALGSTDWMTRQLESIVSMWLDTNLSCMVKPPKITLPKINFNPYNSGNFKITYHFLDPASDTYIAMRKDLMTLMEEGLNIGYFPLDYKQDLENFKYILEKLDHIALEEIKGEKVSLQELNFLGQIDLYLRPYDEPCINFLSFALSNDNKFLNLSLGDPGYLNIILQGPARATLARGGLYNYFEETGSCQTLEHLKRQLQYNTIRQPFWLSTYDVVQEDIDKDNKN